MERPRFLRRRHKDQDSNPTDVLIEEIGEEDSSSKPGWRELSYRTVDGNVWRVYIQEERRMSGSYIIDDEAQQRFIEQLKKMRGSDITSRRFFETESHWRTVWFIKRNWDRLVEELYSFPQDYSKVIKPIAIVHPRLNALIRPDLIGVGPDTTGFLLECGRKKPIYTLERNYEAFVQRFQRCGVLSVVPILVGLTKPSDNETHLHVRTHHGM